jgi:hypothetical protein
VADFQDNYSFFDKALHYLAFKSSKLQLNLAENESEEHHQKLQAISVEKPVFITSLPRSGTTILLDVLTKTDAFSYHSYQDMPFVFTPLMWAKFSNKFAKSDTLTERAHKDGIKINSKSPEAFEEMFFKAFWPELYKGSSVALWPQSTNQKATHFKFNRFFTDHIKKLLFRDSRTRYISKNNLNITRLPYIRSLFGDAIILIPFREPIQHALSLLRQHQNFTALHGENKFSKDYMAAIGHFDFGANLKPVNFNQWFDNCEYSPDTLDFWLAYWIECYQYLLDNPSGGLFVCFERLCKDPEGSFNVLAEQLQLEPQTLLKSVGEIKVAKIHAVDLSTLNGANVVRAEALYQALDAVSL